MKKSNLLRKVMHWWMSLYLADRFLLIFMVILQVQTAHNLFFNELAGKNAAALDVVIRTTAAAIFGYFISAGFRGEANDSDVVDPIKSEQKISCDKDYNRRIRQQTIIVASIGISSLLFLILARNYNETTIASHSTISQMRDFVSGSVGFLIGHTSKVS